MHGCHATRLLTLQSLLANFSLFKIQQCTITAHKCHQWGGRALYQSGIETDMTTFSKAAHLATLIQECHIAAIE
jgi:hypothetical protein